MRLRKDLFKSIFDKAVMAGAVLSAMLLFAWAPGAKADDWDNCNRRVAYSEWRLHEAIEYFGYDSPQARHWRHEPHEAYEQLERYIRQRWREPAPRGAERR